MQRKAPSYYHKDSTMKVGLSGNDKTTRRRRGPYRPTTSADIAESSWPAAVSNGNVQSATFHRTHRAVQKRRKSSPMKYAPWLPQKKAPKSIPIKALLHFVIMLVAGVFLVTNFAFLMNTEEFDSTSQGEVDSFDRKRVFHTFESSLKYSETTTRALDAYAAQRGKTQEAEWTRNKERQGRTRPPQHNQFNRRDLEMMKPYGFDLLHPANNDVSIPNNNKIENGDQDPPSLCGLEALSAYSEIPSFYPSIHGVNADSVVLITGILGRLGFHLAIRLVTHCGVKVMIGVAEALYPEDSTYRLRLLEQISILYSSLPSFKRPLIVAFNGVTPKSHYYQNFEPFVDGLTGELDYSAITPPTHIVHIASSEEDSYLHGYRQRQHADSPYGKHSGVFGLRQSVMGTEQLLASLVPSDSNIHFTFVSDVDVALFEARKPKLSFMGVESKRLKHLYITTKLMEEVMVRSYAENLGYNTFVILRMPTIYGPWGKPGSFDHDLAQKAILHWHDKGTMSRDFDSDDSILLSLTGLSECSQYEEDLLFVDDAINSIVTAMQYRGHDSNISTFNILSGEKSSAGAIADLIETFMPISTHLKPKVQMHTFHDKEGQYVPPNAAMAAKKLLHWTPHIGLREGITKLLAWHLDEHLPFGSRSHDAIGGDHPIHATQSGSAFLKTEKHSPCPPDDLYCLRGRRVYPCASECSDLASCTNSAFDRATELSQLLTEKCEIVLYTTLLTNDVEEIAVQAPDTQGTSICSVAFVSQWSALVEGLSVGGRSDADPLENKELNQDPMVHKGWTLMPINFNELDDIPAELRFLPQLSPGNFFHSSVKAALYLAEDFTLNPTVEDIIFTTDLLHRQLTKNTPYQINSELEKLQYTIGHSERHALIVLPAIRSDNGDAKKVISGTAPTILQKVSFRKALGHMMEHKQAGKDVIKQKEFYSQIPGFFNRCEFSPQCESSFKFILNHWTRHSWVAHSFASKEAKNLRCEWYREHVKWDNENKSFSFAHVITRLQIERFNSLFDDGEKEKMLEEQTEKEIDGSTDEQEWHDILDLESRETQSIRILDERAMIIQRRVWNIRQKLEVN